MDDRSSSRRPQRQGSATRSQRQQPPVRPQRGGRGMHMDMDVLNGRLAIFFVAFCVFALILAIRLFGLMVIDAQANLNRDSSREVTVDVQPRRGTIYDRNGTILATTVDAYNVFCHPHMVSSDKVDQLAQALADAFGGEVQDYKNKITTDSNFAYLYKGADEDGMKKIKDLGIEGVDFEKTTKRVYPCGATASQIIGILNSDGKAITGLELYYDDILGGTAGHKTTEYSKEGVPVPGSEKVTAEVVNGQDIVLSIDVDMQQKLEESLALRVEEVQGKGGSAILMDSATGEIYACSSSPTFDITDLSEVKEGATNLSGISSAYEPGSIMKPLTMLAALLDGKVTLDSTYYCPAALKVDDYTITAPITGTIVDKYYNAGETSESNQVLCTIYDLSYLTMTLDVDELDISSIAVGQTVSVVADAVEDTVYTGVVTKVSVAGTSTGSVATYPVTIRIDDTDGLLPGMSVDATIELESAQDVLAIPASALNRGDTVLVTVDSPSAVNAQDVQAPAEESAGDQSEGADAPAGGTETQYVSVQVTTGVSAGDYIEITSGLQEGDVVAYIPTSSSSDSGMPMMGGGMPGGGGGMPGGGGMGGGPGGF